MFFHDGGFFDFKKITVFFQLLSSHYNKCDKNLLDNPAFWQTCKIKTIFKN